MITWTFKYHDWILIEINNLISILVVICKTTDDFALFLSIRSISSKRYRKNPKKADSILLILLCYLFNDYFSTVNIDQYWFQSHIPLFLLLKLFHSLGFIYFCNCIGGVIRLFYFSYYLFNISSLALRNQPISFSSLLSFWDIQISLFFRFIFNFYKWKKFKLLRIFLYSYRTHFCFITISLIYIFINTMLT